MLSGLLLWLGMLVGCPAGGETGGGDAVPVVVLSAELFSDLELRPPAAGSAKADGVTTETPADTKPQFLVLEGEAIDNTPSALEPAVVPPSTWPVRRYEGPGYFVCEGEHIWASAYLSDVPFDRDQLSTRTRIWVEDQYYNRNSHDWSGRRYRIHLDHDPDTAVVLLYLNQHRREVGWFAVRLHEGKLRVTAADGTEVELADRQRHAMSWRVGPEGYWMTVEMLLEHGQERPTLRYAFRWGK